MSGVMRWGGRERVARGLCAWGSSHVALAFVAGCGVALMLVAGAGCAMRSKPKDLLEARAIYEQMSNVRAAGVISGEGAERDCVDAAKVCGGQSRVCAIAGAYPGEPEFASLCNRANVECKYHRLKCARGRDAE